mgnify:FL=1
MIIEKYTRKRITKIIELFDIRSKKLNDIINSEEEHYNRNGEPLPQYFFDLKGLKDSLDRTNIFLKNLKNKIFIISSKYQLLIFSGNSARDIIEKIINIIFYIKNITFKENESLDSKIKNPNFESEVGIEMKNLFNSIKHYGNRCAHTSMPPDGNDILIVLEHLVIVIDWFIKKYIDKTYSFEEIILPEEYQVEILKIIQEVINQKINDLRNNENNVILEQKVDCLKSLNANINSLNFNLIQQKDTKISSQILWNSILNIIDLLRIHYGVNDNENKDLIIQDIKKNRKDFDFSVSYRYETIKRTFNIKYEHSFESLIFTYKFLLLIVDYFLFLEKINKNFINKTFYILQSYVKNYKWIVLYSLILILLVVILSLYLLITSDPPAPPKLTLNISKNDNTYILKWNKVNNALNYKLTLKDFTKEIFNQNIEDTFYVINDNIRGQYICKVEALIVENNKENVIISADTTLVLTNDTLPPIKNIKIYNMEKIKGGKYYIDDNKIVLGWDKIDKADLYILRLSGRKQVSTKENYYVFNNLDNGGIFKGKDYSLTIYAKSERFNTESPKKIIYFYLH